MSGRKTDDCWLRCGIYLLEYSVLLARMYIPR
jgi:hypothetical protein